MRVAVVGDVGSAKYHVGDEAMTDRAIDVLREHGVTDIVVVADEPERARASFGTDAVARVGFHPDGGPRNPERLEAVTRALESGRGVPPAMAAVQDADALLVAGGGNVSSEHPHHLYERLALSRAARRAGRPVLITSQTFGPLILPLDRPAFDELLLTATAVGVRERDSLRLAQRVGVEADRLTLGIDDAAWLEPAAEDRRWADSLGLGPRLVTMSLTYHVGYASFSQQEYASRAAATADALAGLLDAEVVLVPHLGLIDEGSERIRDVELNDAVVARTRSGRVRALPMARARSVVEVARRSLVIVTTRYHPTVFGPSARVPTVALSTSYYSSLRMRGALGHWGLPDFLLPAETWSPELVVAAVSELVDREAEVGRLLDGALPAAREHSDLWWDSLVASMRSGGSWTPVPSVGWVPRLPAPDPAPEWRAASRDALRITDALTRQSTARLWREKSARMALVAENAELRRKLRRYSPVSTAKEVLRRRPEA